MTFEQRCLWKSQGEWSKQREQQAQKSYGWRQFDQEEQAGHCGWSGGRGRGPEGVGHTTLPFVIHMCAQKQNRLLLIFLLTTPAPCPTSEGKAGESSLRLLPPPPWAPSITKTCTNLTQKRKPTVHIPFNKMKCFPTQNFLNIPFGPNIYVWYQLKRNFLSKHQLHLFFYFCIYGSRKPKWRLSLKKIPEASLSSAWIIKVMLSSPDENIKGGKKWEENSTGVLNQALANGPERTVCALAGDPGTCPRRNK